MNRLMERHPVWSGIALAAAFGAAVIGFAVVTGRDLSFFSLLRLVWIAALPTFVVGARARMKREDAQAQGRPLPDDDAPALSSGSRTFLRVVMLTPPVGALIGGVVAVAMGEFAIGAAAVLVAGVAGAIAWGFLDRI